jgi:hypothetical protein
MDQSSLGGIILLLMVISLAGFLWSLIVSIKKGSAAGIVFSFLCWPIGLIIALSAANKSVPQIVNVYNSLKPDA